MQAVARHGSGGESERWVGRKLGWTSLNYFVLVGRVLLGQRWHGTWDSLQPAKPTTHTQRPIRKSQRPKRKASGQQDKTSCQQEKKSCQREKTNGQHGKTAANKKTPTANMNSSCGISEFIAIETQLPTPNFAAKMAAIYASPNSSIATSCPPVWGRLDMQCDSQLPVRPVGQTD